MSVTRTTEILEGQAGQNGGEVIDDTSLHNGVWYKVAAIEASTVIATLTGNISGGTDVALAVGAEIVGRFTGITLTSGSVIAYDKI